VKKYKRVMLPVIVIVASLLFALVLVLSRPDVETTTPEVARKWVRVLEVKREPVRMSVISQGSVAPRTESNLVAEIAGQVTDVSPSFVNGGFFKAGDVLIRVDARNYNFDLARTKSSVAQAEVRVSLEEQEARVARLEWERLNEGEIPPLVAREPQLAEARAALEAARASLLKAELDLERTRIKAPYDGRVRRKNADIGQYVAPGMTVATVYAVDYVEVRLPLPDHELAYLGIPFDFSSHKNGRLGPEVILRGNFAGREQEWRGYITRIEGEIDARSRMVHAVARVEDPYGDRKELSSSPLAVGMFVHAEILGQTEEELFIVPRGAVRDGGFVLVAAPDSTLRLRSVEVARSASEVAYIRSGLEEGELVCTTPVPIAVDGMPIRIFEDRPTGTQVPEGSAP
jgi:RND family efflux transporter MFP subunit